MMLIRTSTETWNAEYTVQGNRDAQIVRIKSRSSITVVIAKIMENLPLVGKTITYYISVPNYGIALPEIENLNESAWIVDRLLVRNMPRVDAVTIAQVLRDVLKKRGETKWQRNTEFIMSYRRRRKPKSPRRSNGASEDIVP